MIVVPNNTSSPMADPAAAAVVATAAAAAAVSWALIARREASSRTCSTLENGTSDGEGLHMCKYAQGGAAREKGNKFLRTGE